ncbi:AraC family transcriptional regulator [Mycolicibacter terrae]|uniref:AraC family transcriptional regulator n=1 Tax=Mycolicibacter terrae TaxID=1788 RepID=A0ACD2ESS6_9MYCO|nr:AraC family transcriptional regulator [Mycolicibacter terrae]
MSHRHQCVDGIEADTAGVTAPPISIPDSIAHRLGFAPESRLATPDGSLSAAIWRFRDRPYYELCCSADRYTDVIAMPITGHHHHTYFGNGRLKWSRLHPPFHMNMVVAGEQPRALFTSVQPFTYLHVYVRHAMVERLAVDSGLLAVGQTVTLVDPMCSHDPFVEFVFRQILREMSCSDKISRMMLDALGQQLVTRLLRRHSSVSGSRTQSPTIGAGYHDWRLRRTIEYLESHLAEELDLGEIAASVCLSVARLTTLFRDATGEPPRRWLMNRRFVRACELLATSSLSVTEIAHRCGFASSQHLATVMRRRHATTPSDYRRQVLGTPAYQDGR